MYTVWKSEVFLKFPAYLYIMSVLIFIKFFHRNGHQISNVYASAIIGQHHKRVGAAVTANDNKRGCSR